MSIFSRVRDIISSNINAMLDKAEDPEKLVRLMIREMEDTLVEIKASCAAAMAGSKKVQRAQDEAHARAEQWNQRAEAAVAKGRDDLAREALLEQRRCSDRAASLDRETAQIQTLVEQYQSDIMQLEEKLATARERQRLLVQRHVHAQQKKRAELGIRKVETTRAFVRFDKFENRIDRMEAEADLVNYGRKPSIDDTFAELETDEEIERQLAALKTRRQPGAGGGQE